MRLTVIGSGPAAPELDTPASGNLVSSDGTAVLLDCGYGVVGRLRSTIDPRALDGVVIGHLHADHFLDLAALRYMHPWNGGGDRRPAVWLPPGGRSRLVGLAEMMSERPSFFEEAFDLAEYESDGPFEIGDLKITPSPMQHYVPAWAMTVADRSGARLVYGGDTGPTDRLLAAARRADLLIVEATLRSISEDEVTRGHCTLDEAIAIASAAEVDRTLITHYPSVRRADVQAAALAAGTRFSVAVPGTQIDVVPASDRPATADAMVPGQGTGGVALGHREAALAV